MSEDNMTNRPELPSEISQENWQAALEDEARERASMIKKYRKPGDPPIISTVEGEILGEILEQKDNPPSGARSR